MYDLVIKGGRLIDPAQGLDNRLDVAISGDKIALVAEAIPPSQGRQTLEATNKIVTPGLIDMHTHIYSYVFKYAVEPDVAGVRQGVTTVVDGGSAGEAIFAAIPKYIIPRSRTTVFCFLHLGSQGLTLMPELRDREEINLEAIASVIESYRDLIKGIKVRLVGNVVAGAGVEVVRMAQQAARRFGLPVMVHIGDIKKQVPPNLTREVLRIMEKGDILTHVYTPAHGGVLRPDGTFVPELREAIERGVVIDSAMGTYNFSYAIARKGLAQGILPRTISTDLTTTSVNGPVYGLTVTMSKFMALGLDLKSVVEKTTIGPATVLGIHNRKGSLKPGMDADVSVLEVSSGAWQTEDAAKETLTFTRLLVPSVTVKAGQLIPGDPVSRPRPIS